MAVLLISYDLNNAKNYDVLIEGIKGLGDKWWHYLDSTWIVTGARSALYAMNQLEELIDSDDELFVVDISGRPAAWTGFNEQASNWLSSNLRIY